MLKIQARLRITSDRYSLGEIEAILGNSSGGYSKGDRFAPNNNQRSQSMWIMKSSSLPNDSLDSHLTDILRFLDGKKSSISEIENRCKMDIFCMLASDNGQGAAAISSKLLKDFARHPVDIVLDVYAESSD